MSTGILRLDNRAALRMNHNNPWQCYRQVATQTASPGQIVLMLFDGIVRFLEQARTGFHHDDPLEYHQTINNNVLRAQAIIQELDGSLNMDRGGEFSEKMRQLYDYFDRRLQEANLTKTEGGIREVIDRVTVLRDAWSEMLRQGGGSLNALASASAVPIAA